MRILVIGKTGQVARELARLMPQAQFLGRDRLDLADTAACAEVVRGSGAEAIINAAAWTAVDRAETEEAAAMQVNAKAPAAMARAAAAKGVPFLHLSSDYVFDGAGSQPFRPDHRPAPLGAYGRSKLAGEDGVRAAGGRHLILRTSWVVSAHGGNFVRTMLRLGQERQGLRVVADQIGGPTPASAIAGALLVAARALRDGAAGGTQHFCGMPDTSWAGFARDIMARAALSCQVQDIASCEYPTPARRPLNSRLDCAGFTAAFGLSRPDWRRGLADIIRELTT